MGDNLNGIFANMIQGMGFIGCAPNRVYNMAPPDGGGVEATAEGTELTLHSAAAPLTALTLYGKSEQRTTTGAQLFDAGKEKLSYSADDSLGLTTTYDPETGWFHTTGTLTGGVPTYWRKENLFNMKSGVQYYFSVETVGENDYIALAESGVRNAFPHKNMSVKQQVDTNANQIYANRSYEMGTEFDLKFRIMISMGSTAPPWEPYTGGAPSPSPDYPQEIESVGDIGTVNVTLSDGGSQSHTLPVQTPNGLPGIPVDSGGNYTDADGQQWVCDEVDFKRGVYVQRIIRYTGPFYKTYWAQTDSWFVFASSLANIPKPSYRGFCNISDYYMNSWNNSGHSHWFLQTGEHQIVIHLGDTYNTEEAVEQFIEKNEIVVYYATETPIETPLSPSDLAAYAALRTYSPTTVVSNDAGAWMKVGYKATPQPMTMLTRKR